MLNEYGASTFVYETISKYFYLEFFCPKSFGPVMFRPVKFLTLEAVFLTSICFYLVLGLR